MSAENKAHIHSLRQLFLDIFVICGYEQDSLSDLADQFSMRVALLAQETLSPSPPSQSPPVPSDHLMAGHTPMETIGNLLDKFSEKDVVKSIGEAVALTLSEIEQLMASYLDDQQKQQIRTICQNFQTIKEDNGTK